jgi:hypothetical protein
MADDEFAEFDTDEAAFDEMLARAEPAELVAPPRRVTVLSAAHDAVTFLQGLPITIGNAASTSLGWRTEQSPQRLSPAVRHEQPLEEVAG